MVHRIRLNRRRLLGSNYQIVSANTTTWISGETLPNVPNTFVTNTVPFNQELYSKSIVIPLELKFEPMDYSDIIDDWVDSETQRVVNKILDGEKTKYASNELTGITIDFRFVDKGGVTVPAGQYSNSYRANDFDPINEYKLNRFKKSYFRLYFYDSNNSEKANLLFTEDLPVTETRGYGPSVDIARFTLKNLYWDLDDPIMDNTLIDRVVYIEARFFNAKNGKIQTFYNLPTTNNAPIGITQYSDINNRSWRTSPLQLTNPNNSNGDYRFKPLIAGGTTETKITFSEFILS